MRGIRESNMRWWERWGEEETNKTEMERVEVWVRRWRDNEEIKRNY